MTGKKTTILVADDNKDFSDSIRDLLELEGYQTVGACNGVEAIEVIKKTSPDLVFMDMIMPVMDGLTAIPIIREIAPALPIIVLTALGDEKVLGEVMQAGARHYLSKPINIERMHECIRELLD